jgi:hypothetical protein
VVDPQAGQVAGADQVEQQLVRRGEHHRVLDPDRGERVDVEEAPVVELVVRGAPPGQAVPLALHELRQRELRGPRPDRELVVVVAQHRLVAGGVEHDLAGGQHLADPLPEHRHEQRPVRHGPVDVEPARVGRARAVAQHRPQRRVQPGRCRHRHVVRDDVRDRREPVLGEHRRHPVERLATAGLGGEEGVVDDVVPVRRARRRPQDR